MSFNIRNRDGSGHRSYDNRRRHDAPSNHSGHSGGHHGHSGRHGRPGYSSHPQQGRQDRYSPEENSPEPAVSVTGVLDVIPDGFGFLRTQATFEQGADDPYVPASHIRNYRLRAGSLVTGTIRGPRKKEKHPTLETIDRVEGIAPDQVANRPWMTELVPLVPNRRLRLETKPEARGTRIIDLLVPVGMGQRGVIVAPPKAGKTMLLQEVARAVATNYPEMPLFILLIDERPEEVTDFRSMGVGTVVASSFDSSPQSHLRAAEITLARCQRIVEAGKDVFMLLDSLTRLTRTANVANRGTGRSLSGGLDPAALQLPRTLLGAARNIENGGSLTILATALVETDSRMDDVIFEEFKGTGNWELKLDRKLADRRIFPAFDLSQSGTRREEILYTQDEIEAVRYLRRALLDSAVNPTAQMEQLLRLLDKHKTNGGIIDEVLQVAR